MVSDVTRVAVISDTHLPAAGPDLPPGAIELIESAAHLLHAGDVINPASLFDLRVLAGGSMTIVEGNRDHALDLPDVATYETDGVRVVLTHGHSFSGGVRYRDQLARVGDEYDAEVAIGGHTHDVLDDVVEGVRVLNPGSVTGAAPAMEQTMQTLECAENDVSVTTHTF